MRLNRLEINGFKSFPDRADLAFDLGVTAIVGPNGCGKSNVVDAITWVLGEQSAKSLRGERMEDVIFAGSDARKPTHTAEVKLKMSGVISRVGLEDHPQKKTMAQELEESAETLTEDVVIARDVEVARRLYRSGESEYLVDGRVVRLRDVQDLLMDAGLGVKGYAVIEQGKIGQILAAKPTERRQLIEEAAGVTKYKSRRRQAELKLEAAQQNLTRVDDIIFELEKQRGSLKRQASKARRYRTLREELRQWEKLLFGQKYQALQAAMASAVERLEQARGHEAGLSGRVAEVEAALERLRIELTEADAAANAARQAAHAKELESGRRQQQLEFDLQQVQTIGAALVGMLDEIGRLKERIGPAHDELEARRAGSTQADRERDEAAARVKEEDVAVQRAAGEIAALEQAVEKARGELYAGMTQVNTLRNAIERAIEARDRIAQELGRLEVESDDLRVEQEAALTERERASSALREAQAALEQVRNARVAADAALGAGRVEREWRERELRTRERELSALQARLQSLEELDAARAEYGEGARLLLASGADVFTHLGSVADALEVDGEYETAVAACLGELVQHVVVPDLASVQAGLALVRDRDAGRVGFLVADDVMPAEPVAPPVPGVRSLLDVVRVNGPAATHVRAVLRDAWLAESAAQAREAARYVAGPVVTPQGDVYRGAKLVSGGGKADARQILHTKAEIKGLREQVQQAHGDLERLAADLTAAEAVIARVAADIATLTSEQVGHEKSIVGLELQVNRASDERDRVARRMELIDNERRRAQEERAALEAREAEARRSIEDLEVEQQSLSDELADAQRRLLDGRERQASIGRRAAEARATHAALVERASALGQDVRRLEDASADLLQRIAARQAEVDASTTRRTNLEGSISALRAAIDDDLAALDDLKHRVIEADEAVAAVQAAFGEHEASAREARRGLDDVRSMATSLEIARATAEADLGHLAESCREALDQSLEEVAAAVAEMLANEQDLPSAASVAAAERAGADEDAVDASADAAAESGAALAETAGADATAESVAEPAPPVLSAEQAITRLKARIAALGAVNMMAIEQFDELEQRHGFLTGQRKDLIDAIASTGEAISRIDKTTRERFAEAFAAVNANFEVMFTTLFGGGRAGLVLLDQEDVLESGIDIVAQPPGKRLQNVQLLSGGEKALTAMALMFGIFKYRPSPFCLLDEIDAPLDDANIGRFVEMLRSMQDYTQFVLITHHRKTMEIADRLYGVTMEEPGVSKVLRLDLTH
jgi:chromosome segregation protein